MDRLKKWLKVTETYMRSIGKWILIGVIVGTICGLIGTLFHVGVEYMTEFRGKHSWLLFLLPVFGLIITGIYKLLTVEGHNTNHILEAVHSGRQLSFLLLPAIFFSTILTHLGGGSAGREGAALQMGGTIGFHVGRKFSLHDKDIRIATMCGMSAFFSALFGTPMAATVFSLGVISVGIVYHAALIPCLTGALTAYGISTLLGVEPTHFAVEAPALSAVMLLKTAVLGILCAGVSILFCAVMHETEHLAVRYFKNKWLRAASGGVIIILFTLLYGSQRYNGAGMAVIEEALTGHSHPWDFLMKILFTAVTLSFGFKGGEVVPSFFTGAVFGCFIGPFLGIPAGFAAAVGLASVFCGVANVPLASVFLAVELFGAEGMLYFAVACAMSYAFSGYKGLYSSQKILYHKLKAEYINIHTNDKNAVSKNDNDA
ncbi:MAG: chloride channel protein [Lachnospiraceae bacterium]|nr:chloride channel protein [Lachnospiraceae bacterium]